MAKIREASINYSASQPRNKRARRIGVALLTISAIFFGVNFAQRWWTVEQAHQRGVQLQQQIAATQAANDQLRRDIDYYGSKQFIIDQARVIGMSRPGDTLISINWQSPPRRTSAAHRTRNASPPNIFVRILQALFS